MMRALTEAGKKGATLPEVTCFEKQSDWAGVWNVDWR